MTKMRKSVDKNLNIVINMFKDLKENVNIINRHANNNQDPSNF